MTASAWGSSSMAALQVIGRAKSMSWSIAAVPRSPRQRSRAPARRAKFELRRRFRLMSPEAARS